jgi:hypothetical protein
MSLSAAGANGHASGILSSSTSQSVCTTFTSETTYSPGNTSVVFSQNRSFGSTNTENFGAADYLGGTLDYSSSTTTTPSSTDVLRSSTINGVAATNDQNSQHGSTSTTVTSSSTSTSPGVYVTISFTATETAPWSQSTNTSTTYGSMGNVVTSNQVFSNSNGEYYSFTRAYAQSTGLSNSATVTYSDAPTDTGYTYSMSESNSGTTSSGTGLTLSTSANFSIGQSSSQSITRDYNLTQSWYGPSSRPERAQQTSPGHPPWVYPTPTPTAAPRAAGVRRERLFPTPQVSPAPTPTAAGAAPPPAAPTRWSRPTSTP